MTEYHSVLKRTLEAALAHEEFPACVCAEDAKGRPRPNKFLVSRLLYTIAPQGWGLAPLRDYLIGDATAMLMSHLSKEYKGKHDSNPPQMPRLEATTEEEYRTASENFTQTHEFPLKPQHEEKIQAARDAGHTQVAHRLERIYENWAASKAAGKLLQSLDPKRPRPIEFTRPEFGRGFVLARKGNKFYFLMRLFSRGHRYFETRVMAEGFADCRTGESLAGKKYPGVILPLELGREYHDAEYLQHGSPQSAKLVVKIADDGSHEFFVHMAFEFEPEPVAAQNVLGLDRGAAKLGVGTLVNLQGDVLQRGIELGGAAFSAEMQRYRSQIAELQRKGIQKSRRFKVRGARADIVVGEYANRIVKLAVEHKAHIALEKIDKVTMNKFLTQSQFGKLQQMLSYKAARAGLPEPLEVPAAYTSQTCAVCGHKDPANRPKKDSAGKSIQDNFLCVACGHSANADNNASEIIALRALHQLQCDKKFQKFPLFQLWLKELLAGKPNMSNQAGQ